MNYARRSWMGPIAVVLLTGLLAATAGCGGSAAQNPQNAGTPGVPGTEPPGAGLRDIAASSPGEPRRGGLLRLGLAAATDNLDPTRGQWAGQGYQIARAIYDPLVSFDSEGMARPYLAKKFEPNKDFTEWRITVRDGVTFHDGAVLDAVAVKANLDASRTSIVTGQIFAPVRDVTIVDESTVSVTMTRPWSTFPGYLSAQPGFIASPSTIKSPTGGANPSGTGPFRFVSQGGGKITTQRNEAYWRKGLPLLDRVEFQVISDSTARTQALKAGDVDLAELTLPDQIASVNDQARDGALQFFIEPKREAPAIVVAFNTAKPPFDDLTARRAVATALDTEALSQDLFQGLFPPSKGPLREGSAFYTPSGYPSFDLEAAKRLGEQYTIAHGAPLKFTINVPPDPSLLAIAQRGSSMLATVGIDMQVSTPEQTKLLLDALTGNYEATGFVLFGAPTIEAAYIFLHGSTAKPPGQIAINFTRFSSPEMDGALDNGRKTLDVEDQRKATHLAQRQLGEQVPYAFLVHMVSAVGARNDVRGVRDAKLPDGENAITLDGTNVWLSQLWTAR